MSRVDFYILSDDNTASLQKFVCKLAEKAWLQGQRILIQTSAPDESQRIDDMLWTFRDGSFIPHATLEDSMTDDSIKAQPILISHSADTGGDYQLMINLSPHTPAQVGQFERIAEIVNQEPGRKQASREHYKRYRNEGYELHHHEIN